MMATASSHEPQPVTPTTTGATAAGPAPPSSKKNNMNKRVSTIDHLLRNPPPELAAAPESFLARFPSLAQSSPSLVQLFRKTAPSAAKRQSVMNLPANLVSERQAYFEGEIAAELAKLESSKEWFDIQKYVESYFGITLVTSSDSPLPPMPALPPLARPRTPPPPTGPSVPSIRSSPPKSAPPRTPTPTSATGLARPTTPTGRPTTPTLRPATPPAPRFGVHPSLARCLSLLPDIAATWADPLGGKDYLTLAAPISEFLFHYKSSSGPADLLDLSLVTAILSEMEAVDAATNGDLAPEDLDAWKRQVAHLLLSDRVRVGLAALEQEQKRVWAESQLAKVRKDMFLATVKHLSSTGALKKRTDEDALAGLRSGAVLVKFILSMVDVLNARAEHEFALTGQVVDADEARRVLMAHDGQGLVDVTRNWMAVARGALKYLNLDLAGAWHVKVLTLGTAKPAGAAAPAAADEQIELVTALLGVRFSQISGTPLVDTDSVDVLREYLAMVHLDRAWTPLAPLRCSSSPADRVAVTPAGDVFTHAADQTWAQSCPLAKHTVATARAGAHASKVLRAPDVKGTKATWHFQRYVRILDLLSQADPAAHLARVTHVEIPDLHVLPKLTPAALPRTWMPMTPELVLHLDSRDTRGAMPLEAYFARAYTFQPATTSSTSSGASAAGAGVLRVDRDRAYTVNRLLLQVFQHMTQSVCDLHESHMLAHGSLSPSHVLLLGDPHETLRTLLPTVRLLPPAFHLAPPATYVPGHDNGGYDSTLADDVLALGQVFAQVMDKFWYRRPLVSPTAPDPPEVVRRSMSEPLLESVPEGLPITPSLEMHQERQATLVRQSTGSFASSSEDSMGSRPGSAALVGRGSRSDSVMDGPGVVSAPPTPGRREGGAAGGKKKKRPITIHLAPSIHPPWSPLYNEAATTVIPRPDTPEPARAQLSAVPDADAGKDLPPVPPIPGHPAGAVEPPPPRAKTPTLVGELASNEQDRRMDEIYQGLMALVGRMTHKDEKMRPVVREVLEYF